MKTTIQTELFSSRIVEATEEEIVNDIIERAGVRTITITGVSFWEYMGQKVKRPNGLNWESVLEEEFGIVIKYI